jgi:hypothetical protein
MYGNMGLDKYKIGRRIETFEQLYFELTTVGFVYCDGILAGKDCVFTENVKDLELAVSLGNFRKAVKIFNFFNFFKISGLGKLGKIRYSEEEVRELFIKRAVEFSVKHKHFAEMLLKQDMDWFERSKKPTAIQSVGRKLRIRVK